MRDLTLPVEIDGQILGKHGGAFFRHPVVQCHLVRSQAHGVLTRLVVVGEPAKRRVECPAWNGSVQVVHLTEQCVSALVTGSELLTITSLRTHLGELAPQSIPFTIGAGLHPPVFAQVVVDRTQRTGYSLHHLSLFARQLGGREVECGSLQVASKVDHAEDGVVLSVDARQPAGDGCGNSQSQIHLTGVEVLQRHRHPLRPWIPVVQEQIAILAVNPQRHDIITVSQRRVDPLRYQPGNRVDVLLLRFLDNTPCIERVEAHVHQLIRKRLATPTGELHVRVDREPEVGVGVLHSQAVQRRRHPVLLSAGDGVLTLQCDVRQDVSYWSSRPGGSAR